MTVANNYAPARYVGNGSTRSFAVSWRLENDDDFVVYQKVGGVQSVVNPSNYTAVNTDNEHGVVFNTAPANGTIIVITRATPHEQDTPYKTSSGFQAIKVEEDFDSLTMMVQELQNGVDRAVKVPETSTETQQHFSDSLFAARDQAVASAQAAHESEANAISKAADAQMFAEEAEIHKEDAQDAATIAGQARDNAIAANASAVHQVELAAAESAEAARQAGNAARDADAAEAAERNAATSATNAATSATNASTSATNASTSATNASASAALAEKWATYMDGKVDGNEYSAKYYADLAGQNAGVLTGANKDLSNLTAAGEARFTAKQDVIDSSHKLSASLVSGLATVATSGAYSDLSGTPNMANYVTLAGVQTITGAKTFSSTVITGAGEGVKFNGTNHYYTMRSAGNPYEGVGLFLDNDANKSALTAYVDKIVIGSSSLPAYAVTPTDTTTTNGTQIATTGWVNSTNNNVVHRTGNETIAGTKTFTASPYVNNAQPKMILKSSTITKGTAPASYTEVGFVSFGDKNDETLGRLRYYYDTNKDSTTQITAYKSNSASDSASASIGVKYPASGSSYGFAPASDVNGSILTTVNKSKSSNGYYKLGNGLIIQWFSIGTGTNFSVTFPTPFSSATSYSVASGTMYNSGGETWALNIKNRTSTGFTGLLDGRYDGAMCIAIGY